MWSASLTRSVGVLLAEIRRSGDAEGVAQQRAGLAGDRLGERAQLSLRHAATAGRASAHSRACSSWALSENSRASDSNGPTSWTASGKPSPVKPGRDGHGRLAGVVERGAVGRPARLAGQSPDAASCRRTRARATAGG